MASVAHDRQSPACKVQIKVDDGEQDDPHHIDEVPVQAEEFNAQVVAACETAARGAQQRDQAPHHADDHVQPVETRQV